MENWVILGGSRGLGRSFLERAVSSGADLKLYQFSRKFELDFKSVTFFPSDFSKESHWREIIEKVLACAPHRIFYFAAGGPHGEFAHKEWKDHKWAMQVSFEFPAFLLHSVLNSTLNLQQILFVGSAVAESSPDPMAASYCAAKHALLGLITSVQKENPHFDLRLFSPGYIDTQMLPSNAWPRQRRGLVTPPEKVAELLWNWIHNADDLSKHFVLKSSL